MQTRYRPGLIVWLLLGACSWLIADVVSAVPADLFIGTLPSAPSDLSTDSMAAVDAALQRVVVLSELRLLVKVLVFGATGSSFLWIMLQRADVTVSWWRWTGYATVVFAARDFLAVGGGFAALVMTENFALTGLVRLGIALAFAWVLAWSQGRLLRSSGDLTFGRSWQRAALVGWCIVAVAPVLRAIPVAGVWLPWGALLAPGALAALTVWRASRRGVRAIPEVPIEAPPVQ